MMMIFCGFFLGVAWAMFGFLVWDGIKFRKELKAGLDRRLDISMDTSREYFAKLKKEGRLTGVGGRKSGYWDVSG